MASRGGLIGLGHGRRVGRGFQSGAKAHTWGGCLSGLADMMDIWCGVVWCALGQDHLEGSRLKTPAAADQAGDLRGTWQASVTRRRPGERGLFPYRARHAVTRHATTARRAADCLPSRFSSRCYADCVSFHDTGSKSLAADVLNQRHVDPARTGRLSPARARVGSICAFPNKEASHSIDLPQP